MTLSAAKVSCFCFDVTFRVYEPLLVENASTIASIFAAVVLADFSYIRVICKFLFKCSVPMILGKFIVLPVRVLAI